MKREFGTGLLLKGLLTGFGLASSVAAAAVFILGAPESLGYDTHDQSGAAKTLALAPISIGNPTIARYGLETVTPNTPKNTQDSDEAINVAVYQSMTARAGDTLAGLLTRAGASRPDAAAAISAVMEHFNPRHFRQGQVVKVAYRADSDSLASQSPLPGAFQGFSLQPTPTTELRVSRAIDGDFRAWQLERPLTTKPTRAQGVITSSLYVAGKKAGLTNAALAELIRAYSWDVDFQRDIREGDSFEVYYDREVDDQGKTIKSDVIHYAALTLSGKPNRIYQFTSKDGHTGYYSADGHSAQKALMRTPIDGARLSSGFGRRKHPILGYTKMHKGVDFAAPRGTPIYAAGNGVISYAGRKGGYGNYIRIRHNATYSTAYAHMKGFRRGIHKGARVNQGDVIGYVGTTGRSTGPHLHYEILKNNRQANPLRIKMPSGEQLKGDQLEAFLKAKDAIDDAYAALPSGPQKTASAE